MLKILIAVDGSAPANRAISAVGQMARSSADVAVVLVCVRTGAVLEPLFAGDYSTTTLRQLDNDQESEQAATLARAAALAKELGIKSVESIPAHGVIAHEIVRIAREKKVDQIAMGTRGMGVAASLLLGSVAQRVLDQADVPVLMVK